MKLLVLGVVLQSQGHREQLSVEVEILLAGDEPWPGKRPQSHHNEEVADHGQPAILH